MKSQSASSMVSQRRSSAEVGEVVEHGGQMSSAYSGTIVGVQFFLKGGPS